MSYKNIIAAGLARLETQKQLEELEAARLAEEEKAAATAYEHEAIQYASQIIHPDLVEFLTVTSDKSHWGYGFSLDIPECNSILFQITQAGKLDSKFTTASEPELMTGEEEDDPKWIYNTRWEDYKDLEIAIAHAYSNRQLFLKFTAEIEAEQAKQIEPTTLPTFEEIKQALLDEDYARVIGMCRLHL